MSNSVIGSGRIVRVAALLIACCCAAAYGHGGGHHGGGSGGGPVLLAGTYYVRTTGSNGNVGTGASKAWRTISYALSKADPGDTIYVGAGTYSERLDTSHAASGTKVLKIIGDTTGVHTGDAGVVEVKSSGPTIRHRGTARLSYSNILIDSNSSGDTVWIEDSHETTFTSCTIEACGDDAVVVRDGATVMLRSCDIVESSGDGVAVEGGHAVVEGCLIDNPGGEGVHVRNSSSSVEIQRTRILGAGSMGVYLKGDGVLVNCAIVGSVKDGVYVSNNIDAEIVNSTIVDCGHHGIECGTNSVMNIHNNIIAHVTKNALKGKGHSSSTQSNNIFWEAGHGYVGSNASTAESDRTVDPMLTSMLTPRVSAGSPAINTAMDAGSWTSVDIDSRPRPYLGGWDVGAYEWDPSDGSLFVDVSGSSGFERSLTSDGTIYSSGLHWGDIDNDGNLDCLATGSNSHLFFNKGDGTFLARAFATDSSQQGALVDFDNDGDLDYWGGRGLYYEAYFENNGAGGLAYSGDGGFPEVSIPDGVSSGDFDGDGLCDLVVCAWNARWLARNSGATPLDLEGDMGAGMDNSGAWGGFISSGDVNGDGLLDVFDHSRMTNLFLSDGDGTFTRYARTGISEDAKDFYRKRGSAWGDYDNDGDLDLVYCSRDKGVPVRLYRNGGDWDTGAGGFIDVSRALGLSNTDRQRGCAWGDYDNDGDLDLVIGVYDGADVVYENQGAPGYNFVALDGEPMSTKKTNDIVFVDYDNDGDLDIASSSENGNSVLLKNSTNNTNYLKVRVVGSGVGGTPVSANGVKVELYAADGTTYLGQRTIFAARGYAGSTPQWAHFGVADPAAAYVVKVYFNNGLVAEKLVTPSAVSSTIGGNPVAQLVTVRESDFASGRVRVVKWDEVSPVE